MITQPNERRILTVQQWKQQHEWPSEGGLRYLIFNSERNGFSGAFLRIGRRVLIDEKKFFECVDRVGTQSSAALR